MSLKTQQQEYKNRADMVLGIFAAGVLCYIFY